MCNMCKKVLIKNALKIIGDKDITLGQLSKDYPTNGHYCSNIHRSGNFLTVKTNMAEKVDALLIAQKIVSEHLI